MKTFRILGAFFCIFGCIFALLGVVSSVIPLIENDQLSLIISAFQENSADSLTNTLNAIVIFCLHNGYFLLFCGISLTVVGGLISSSAQKRQKSEHPDIPDTTPHRVTKNTDTPKPAYYPGGLEPTMVSLTDEREIAEKTDIQVVSTMSKLKTKPISGGVELAFVSDSSDAEKLMQNDEQLQSHTVNKRTSSPDYSQYNSNIQVAKPPAVIVSQEHPRIKIVSTMGKNKR